MADQTQALKALTAQALLGVPAFLKRGLDGNKLNVVAAPAQMGYGHPAIASVADDAPNTIRIHDQERFKNATGAQRTGLLAHELTHAQMDKASPGLKFAAINQDDPYSYDENNLANKKVTDFSPEQLAKMVETNAVYQSDPTISLGRKQQVAAQYAPIIKQLQTLPPPTIQTDQTGQSTGLNPTLNTTPVAPAPLFDSGPLVTPTASGPTSPAPMGSQAALVAPPQDPFSPPPGFQPEAAQSGPPPPPPGFQPEQTQPQQPGFLDQARRMVEDVGYPMVGGALGAAAGGLAAGVPTGGVGLIPGVIAGAGLGAAAGNELKNGLRDVSGQESEHGGQRVLGDATAAAGGLLQGGDMARKAAQPAVTEEATSLFRRLFPKSLPDKPAEVPTLTSTRPVIDDLHTNVQKTMANYAQRLGVDADVKPTTSIYDSVKNTGDAVKQKALAGYKQIDDILGDQVDPVTGKNIPVHYQGFDDKIEDLQHQIGAAGKDQALKVNLMQQQQAVEAEKAAADAKLRGMGYSKLMDETTATYKKAKALGEVSKALQASTTGVRADQALSTEALRPEALNPMKFEERMLKLHNNTRFGSEGRLNQALDKPAVDEMFNHTNNAQRNLADINKSDAAAKAEAALRDQAYKAQQAKVAATRSKNIKVAAAVGVPGAGAVATVHHYLDK